MFHAGSAYVLYKDHSIECVCICMHMRATSQNDMDMKILWNSQVNFFSSIYRVSFFINHFVPYETHVKSNILH